jgi:hypothetical protein
MTVKPIPGQMQCLHLPSPPKAKGGSTTGLADMYTIYHYRTRPCHPVAGNLQTGQWPLL